MVGLIIVTVVIAVMVECVTGPRLVCCVGRVAGIVLAGAGASWRGDTALRCAATLLVRLSAANLRDACRRAVVCEDVRGVTWSVVDGAHSAARAGSCARLLVMDDPVRSAPHGWLDWCGHRRRHGER